MSSCNSTDRRALCALTCKEGCTRALSLPLSPSLSLCLQSVRGEIENAQGSGRRYQLCPCCASPPCLRLARTKRKQAILPTGTRVLRKPQRSYCCTFCTFAQRQSHNRPQRTAQAIDGEAGVNMDNPPLRHVVQLSGRPAAIVILTLPVAHCEVYRRFSLETRWERDPNGYLVRDTDGC